MKTYEANKDLWRTKEKWDPLRQNTLRNLTNFAISCKVVKLTVISFCKSVNSEKQLLIEKDLRLPSYAICICIYAKVEKRLMCMCAQFMHIVHEPHLCMNYNQHHVLENIKDYHHMQYRVNPSHQSWEKGQCAYVHNLCTLCMNHIYAWTITSTIWWETSRTIIICNIESIRATKVEKKANVHMCTIYAHCLCIPI